MTLICHSREGGNPDRAASSNAAISLGELLQAATAFFTQLHSNKCPGLGSRLRGNDET
jgi:hypothetical protein